MTGYVMEGGVGDGGVASLRGLDPDSFTFICDGVGGIRMICMWPGGVLLCEALSSQRLKGSIAGGLEWDVYGILMIR